MSVPPLLLELLSSPGPSGYEQQPAAIFRKALSEFAEVTYDTMGATVGRVAGRGDGPSVAIVGHMDEIGLLVHYIDDDGFLWLTPVGGWDPDNLVGQRVELLTKHGKVPGVIGKKAPHLLSEDERKKKVELKDLHIDIGVASREEAQELVRIGDVAVIAADPIELPNRRLVSRALDNRIGCYLAYEAARLVSEAGGAVGDVFAVATTEEEIGTVGAGTTGYSLNPDIAIIAEVTHETSIPQSDEKKTGRHRFGSGPVITRGSTLHPQVFELLHDAAEAEGIPFTVDGTGRRTGTDADGMHRERGGIPCGAVSVPIRYMHSAVEMAQLDDIESSVRLLAATALRLTADISFLR